jgi:hypothetical protein
MNENDAKEKAALVFHIINLQARIDAVTAIVASLAIGHGSTHDKFYSALKTVIDASVQKRLEQMEGQNPGEAALIDLRKEIPDIDQKFLDELKFDDEPE